MTAVCTSNNLYWIQSIKSQKPLSAPNLPSIDNPVYLHMMNSGISSENDVDSKISDSEVNHLLSKHHSSPILPSQKIENQIRVHYGQNKKLKSQLSPIYS